MDRQTGHFDRLVITGHSLGGALATLAAVGLVKNCGACVRSDNLTVMTYGSPRVGR